MPTARSFLCVCVSERWNGVASWVALLGIVLIAAVFRWTALDWDDYRHFHPDERYITWVATTIEPPTSLDGALTPSQSTFNPFYWSPTADSPGIVVPQDEQRAFAYGHFPLYLGVAATKLSTAVSEQLAPQLPSNWLLTRDVLNRAQRTEYFHLTAVARALTGLFDLGTVVMLFLLGKRLFGTAVGLISAALLAGTVLHIQLAHFFISDPYLTFFVVTAVYAWVQALYHVPRRSIAKTATQQRRRVNWWLTMGCIMAGFAVGSKFAAVLLIVPMFIAFWTLWPKGWWWRFGAGVLLTFATFFITNPFAIIDMTCEVITPAVNFGPLRIPTLDWGSCYLDNIVTQRAMVSGAADLPFTRQYSGTLPYLYYVEMLVKWGMGPLLGILGIVGFGWALLKSWGWVWLWGKASLARGEDSRKKRSLRYTFLKHPLLLVMGWCVPYFVSTGSFYVKFLRYMQPLVPFLILFGVGMVWQWKKRPFWRSFVLTAVALTTLAWAIAFINMYNAPHPWLVASGWIYANVPNDTLILSEKWDDSLPTSMTVNENYRRRDEYRNEALTWLTKTEEEDDEAKLMVNLGLMAEAEYLTVVSNRVYGVVPRLDERYPVSSQYYDLLFDGSLGYEPILVADRSLNLLGVPIVAETFKEPDLTPPEMVQRYLNSKGGISWGRADESFTVYDQPLTIIFENKEHLTVNEMRELFEVEN